ncbi:hypothetical protein LWC34_11235 [Kibdelosporangium philippinense]|uniref:TAP-like protein n=2 Tax=Kibdelosporangium philippinense TaxID=211113 RepID=A0ABS8Z7L9_9PSEU|nr:hypothetical protein [Kibdelosporangium philippinense]MCE7003397.1 hypothetical protein [Kibdelosporangium philippinense]
MLSIASLAPFGIPGFFKNMVASNENKFKTTAAHGEAGIRPLNEASAAAAMAATGPNALVGMMPPVDKAVMTDELTRDFAECFAEGLSTGIDGYTDDYLAFTQPWGFELSGIAVPTFIWQGALDTNVPLTHGEWLAAHVPNAVAHLEPDDGHMSVTGKVIPTGLDELVKTL